MFIVGTTTHANAFVLAQTLVPAAVWVAATGDIGQCQDEDIGLEDINTGATMVLHYDGTATFGITRLASVSVHLMPSDKA